MYEQQQQQQQQQQRSAAYPGSLAGNSTSRRTATMARSSCQSLVGYPPQNGLLHTPKPKSRFQRRPGKAATHRQTASHTGSGYKLRPGNAKSHVLVQIMIQELRD